MRRALKLTIGIVLAFLCIRYLVFFAFAPRPYAATQGYLIPNSSMAPSIKKGDRIFILKYIEAGIEPQRLDPVVFKSADDSQMRIARIIGLPGETIQIREGKVLIDNKLLATNLTYSDAGARYGWNTQLQPGAYFLMGDNGGQNNSGAWQSMDSRFVGPISKHELIGVVKRTYWPPWRIGVSQNPSLDRSAVQ